MALTLAALAIVVVMVLIWRQQTREGHGDPQAAESEAPDDAHHAVYIKYDKRLCCPAVREMGTDKFLSSEAPSLPLSDCNMATQCQCVYRHLKDRRSKRGRRATDHDLGEAIYYGPERRSRDDRREEKTESAEGVTFEEPKDYFLH